MYAKSFTCISITQKYIKKMSKIFKSTSNIGFEIYRKSQLLFFLSKKNYPSYLKAGFWYMHHIFIYSRLKFNLFEVVYKNIPGKCYKISVLLQFFFFLTKFLACFLICESFWDLNFMIYFIYFFLNWKY